MPRKNSNADYFHHRPKWRDVDCLIPSPHNGGHRRSAIKTTPEAIVMEYRNSRVLNSPSPPLKIRGGKPPWWKRLYWNTAFEWACWLIMAVIAVYLVIFVFGPFVSQVFGKEIDVALTGAVGYDRGKWGSGIAASPTGTHYDTVYPYSISGQVIYNIWSFKPTLEISYKQSKFDFSDWQARVQEARPQHISLRFGLTKTWDWFNLYALAGVSFIKNNADLVELNKIEIPAIRCIQPACATADRPPKTITVIKAHGKHETRDNQFSGKIGAYALWGEKLKIGPEISCEIYQHRPGFSRCREFRSSQFVPNLGLRVQY